jgi:hypothetical protein
MHLYNDPHLPTRLSETSARCYYFDPKVYQFVDYRCWIYLNKSLKRELIFNLQLKVLLQVAAFDGLLTGNQGVIFDMFYARTS